MSDKNINIPNFQTIYITKDDTGFWQEPQGAKEELADTPERKPDSGGSTEKELSGKEERLMFPGMIEQVMAEQYPALRIDGRNRRDRYRRRVPRVADSKEEMRTDSRSEYHPKNDYKAKKHEPKPKEEEKEELYRFPVVDFTV